MRLFGFKGLASCLRETQGLLAVAYFRSKAALCPPSGSWVYSSVTLRAHLMMRMASLLIIIIIVAPSPSQSVCQKSSIPLSATFMSQFIFAPQLPIYLFFKPNSYPATFNFFLDHSVTISCPWCQGSVPSAQDSLT